MALLALAYLAATESAPSLRVVAIADAAPASSGPAFLREGESVALALVVDGVDGRCFAAQPAPSGAGPCEPLDEEALRSIRWYAATPLARDYDNLAFCGPPRAGARCHAPIVYDVHELRSRSGVARFALASEPELSRLGTHRVGATIAWRGTALASAPGLVPGRAGEETADALLQIVVRRDDTYVGFLTEQLGTPFVYVPARLRDGRHQTDERIGADCAALLVYGRRRMGERLRYVAPGGLLEYAEPIRDSPLRAGDILHFGFQTAALSVDRPPLGQLDDSDLVIHTYHGVAEEVPFGTVPYRRARVEILRWKDRGARGSGHAPHPKKAGAT